MFTNASTTARARSALWNKQINRVESLKGAIVILIVGTVLWFFSLQQRANYLTVFQAASPTVRIEIQDKVRYPRC